MRVRLVRFWNILLVPAVVLLAVVPSCGDDGGGGPPGGSGGSGGIDDDSGPDEPPPPDPGICHRLCCSDTDCSTGETCTAFNTGWGTLGTCSGGGWGSDAGSGDDAGSATPLPAGCWTLNTPQCNPITNEGCAAGDACDVGGMDDPEVQPYVDCFGGDSSQGAGEVCDNVDGPFCIPGFRCVSDNP